MDSSEFYPFFKPKHYFLNKLHRIEDDGRYTVLGANGKILHHFYGSDDNPQANYIDIPWSCMLNRLCALYSAFGKPIESLQHFGIEKIIRDRNEAMNCITLGSKGRKFSPHWENISSVTSVLQKYQTDTMKFHVCSVPSWLKDKQ